MYKFRVRGVKQLWKWKRQNNKKDYPCIINYCICYNDSITVSTRISQWIQHSLSTHIHLSYSSTSLVFCVLRFAFGNNYNVLISPWLHIIFYYYLTSNPSPRKHSLCNSINFLHSSSSSPFDKMQASRACFVSGQQQQIFLPDLIPTFCSLPPFVGGAFWDSSSNTLGGAGEDDEFPMIFDVASLLLLLILFILQE